MSSAILTSRLKQLEQSGFLARFKDENGGIRYELTASGKALFPILDQMEIWTQDWLRRDIVAEENLDPDVLFWELRQLTILQKRHPDQRRVARFNLSGVPQAKRCYWIVFEPDDTEVCTKDLGHEVDLTVSAHIQTLVEIWLGHVRLSDARKSRKVSFDGATLEIEAFADWFMLSHFSRVALGNTPEDI